MLSTVRQDILIMIGVLIAAWFVKVIAVFVYLTYSRRQQAAAASATRHISQTKLVRTPSHVILTLPIMTYSAAVASSSSSRDEPSKCSTGAAAAAAAISRGQQQLHLIHSVTYQAEDPDKGRVRRSADLHHQAVKVQQQQQRHGLQRFGIRLSLDSLLLRRPAIEPAAAYAANASASAAGAAADEGDACAICFCEYQADDKVKQLPCKHFYHCECIDPWLRKGTTCPLCKRPVWEPPPRECEPDLGALEEAAEAQSEEHVRQTTAAEQGTGQRQQHERHSDASTALPVHTNAVVVTVHDSTAAGSSPAGAQAVVAVADVRSSDDMSSARSHVIVMQGQQQHDLQRCRLQRVSEHGV